MGNLMEPEEERAAIRELSCLSLPEKFKLHYSLTNIVYPVFKMSGNEQLSQDDHNLAGKLTDDLALVLTNLYDDLPGASRIATRWIHHHIGNGVNPMLSACQGDECSPQDRKQFGEDCWEHFCKDLRKIGC